MTTTYTFGAFCLCPGSRTLTCEGKPIALGSRGFDLLVALVRANGQLLTFRELIAVAWPHSVVESSNLRVQMAHIRRALQVGSQDKRYIASVAGQGYCFVESIHITEPAAEPLQMPQFPVSEPVTSLVPHILPAPLKQLIGRTDTVAELISYCRNQTMLSLVGPAGAGKTTLALVVLHNVKTDFSDGAFFVDLGTVDCLESIVAALALAVGYKTSGSDLLPGLLAHLAGRQALLLFDNCEHVIAAVVAVCSQILAACPRIRLLTTSREALRLEAEYVYLVSPLLTPPESSVLTAQQALQWPAIELFMLRADEGGAQKGLADEEVAAVTELCRRLDGNPHAIGLVASRTATYGLKGLLDVLCAQFALHWQGRRDVCSRQQTVEAMVGWSHNLLSPVDQQVLYRLAVFHGAFSLDAALFVVADDQLDGRIVHEAIVHLADKSLVIVSFADDRMQIRLFETTKAYAFSRLDQQPAQPQVKQRHAMYFAERLHLFEMRNKEFSSQEPEVPHEWPEIGNVRAALEWCYRPGADSAFAATFSRMAASLFLELGLLRESKSCCERALQFLPASVSGSDTELGLLASLAVTYYSFGDYEGALCGVVERGLLLATALNDSGALFHFLAGQHLAMMANGRFHDALAVSERYANAVLNYGELTETVIARWMSGSSRHYLGDQKGANENFLAAAALHCNKRLRKLGYFEAKQQIIASLARARASWIMGQPQAVQLALEAITESRRSLDSFYLCVTLCFHIVLSAQLQQAAKPMLMEMEAATSDHKMAVRQLVMHFLNGLLLSSQENYPQAETRLQHCVDMLPPPKMSVVRLDALQALAKAQKENANLSQALNSINEAIELAGNTGGRYSLADLLCTKAEILLCSFGQQPTDIEALLLEALELVQQQAAYVWRPKINSCLERLRQRTAKQSSAQ